MNLGYIELHHQMLNLKNSTYYVNMIQLKCNN